MAGADVSLSLARGDPDGCDPGVEVMVDLSTEQARSLAVDLFEQAVAVEAVCDREADDADA